VFGARDRLAVLTINPTPRRGVGAEAVGEHVTVALANHHPLLVSMIVVIVFS
jgi:hypothetical protein